MQAQYKVWGKLPLPKFAGELHRLKIGENHLLVAVSGRASRPEHLFRNAPRCRGAFKLARRDRLFDQGAHNVAVPRSWVCDLLADSDLTTGVLVDLVQHLHDLVWHGEHKGLPFDILER